MYVRKEAVLSSQIEGTQASLNDLLKAEAKILEPSSPSDVNEIINYVSALSYGLERIDTLPLSLRLIREIHERLMHGVRGGALTPGEFRRSQNWIGPENCSLSEATFVPPPPHILDELLGNFEDFIRSSVRMPPLIKIGLAHSQFETIHPFLDGNGRVGCLLVTFFLCQQEILMQPVLYLSHYFKQHKARYYDLLQATRTDGNFEAWIKFFLTGVSEVSNEATETARKIVELREEHRALLASELGQSAGRGIQLLEHMFERPIVTVNQAAEYLDVTYVAANRLIDRIEQLGIIVETTGNQRNRRFSYQPYIQLFR